MRGKSFFLTLAAILAIVLGVGSALTGCGNATTTTTTVTTTTSSSGGPGGAAPVRIVIPLSGAEVVPPVQTAATGTFTLFVEGGPSPTGVPRVSYTLEVADITDATAAHIHLGAKGATGDVIVPLFTGPTKTGTFTGVLAEGSLSEGDLTGPMQGKSFQDLLAVVLAGQTYVNVHTVANPDGEIRGQIVFPGALSGATATTTSGAATATTAAGGAATTARGGY
jgi:CHRD domain